MITRKRFFGVAVPILILAGGFAGWLWMRGANPDSASQSPGDNLSTKGMHVRVRVVKPRQGGVERTVTRPGSVHAFQFARLFTKVSGFLQNQKVDIGTQVTAKQLLAEIYAPELDADVHKAESDLEKAGAQVKVMIAQQAAAKANLNQAKTKVEQTQADVESARAMVTLRRQEHKRIASLADMGSVDRELVDEKSEALQAAQASERASVKAVATAQAAVMAAKADVTRAQADLDDARAQVKVAKAILSRAQIWQEYTRIRSPYSGIVTQRGYHDGDFIRAGTAGGTEPPVLTVARTDVMRIVVWVPDPYVRYTRAGEKAVLQIDALPGQTFEGKVSRTAGAEDPSSRTMRTEIDLHNPDGDLAEGMYGSVTIYLGTTKKGLSIPSAALVGAAKDGKRDVFVVRNGHAHRVTVQVGLDDGIQAEILSGIRPDDEVIVQHSPGLADSIPVEVVDKGHARAKDGG